MRSVKGIIIGFLLILLGFAAAQYSLRLSSRIFLPRSSCRIF